MSEIKPAGYLTDFGEFKKSVSFCDNAQALYYSTDYEALQKENAELQSRYSALHQQKKELRSEINLIYEPEIKNLQETNAAQAKRIAELEEDLQFVERWANHHGTKPNVTEKEALSCIQHYPSIAAITKSYKDGVIPSTRNPYAEIESLRNQVEGIAIGIQKHFGLTESDLKILMLHIENGE